MSILRRIVERAMALDLTTGPAPVAILVGRDAMLEIQKSASYVPECCSAQGVENGSLYGLEVVPTALPFDGEVV